jgi:predicted DNA-binding transcriptional regulator AlpA
VSELRAVPTLDELAADPGKAEELPPGEASLLFVKVRNLEAVLLARMIASREAAAEHNGAGDRFLDAAALGALIGKSKSWVEKHTEELPKRRKVGGEGMWSEREVQTWMKHRETWD